MNKVILKIKQKQSGEAPKGHFTMVYTSPINSIMFISFISRCLHSTNISHQASKLIKLTSRGSVVKWLVNLGSKVESEKWKVNFIDPSICLYSGMKYTSQRRWQQTLLDYLVNLSFIFLSLDESRKICGQHGQSGRTTGFQIGWPPSCVLEQDSSTLAHLRAAQWRPAMVCLWDCSE